MAVQVWKIGKDTARSASSERVPVCWYGGSDSGFYYTDPIYKEDLPGELVEIPEN